MDEKIEKQEVELDPNLKFIEEKSYEEMSDILKKPMGTIATLISRAKKDFLEIYKRQYE